MRSLYIALVLINLLLIGLIMATALAPLPETSFVKIDVTSDDQVLTACPESGLTLTHTCIYNPNEEDLVYTSKDEPEPAINL